MDQSSFCSWIWFLVARYLLNTSAVDDHFLDTYLDRFLNTSRHLYLLRFIEVYIFSLCDPFLISLISLDLSVPVHLPNTLFFTPNLFLEIFQAFFLSQSRQHLDTWWINRECSCLLDSFSIPGGSIELLFLDLIPCCSILARYLSCRRPFSRYLPR